MSRLLPFGGVRSRHLSSRFEKRNFQNLVALFIGWFCGMSPPLMMVIVAYSQTFWLDFFILYTMLSLMILHVICFVLFMRNMKMFIRSPFMVPVTITSQRLHGLHNNFDDLTPDVFADLSVATCLPDRILPDVIQYMALFDEGNLRFKIYFWKLFMMLLWQKTWSLFSIIIKILRWTHIQSKKLDREKLYPEVILAFGWEAVACAKFFLTWILKKLSLYRPAIAEKNERKSY